MHNIAPLSILVAPLNDFFYEIDKNVGKSEVQ